MRINLGCGISPVPGYVNHDKTIHSAHVDVAHDLEVLPWPWEDGSAVEVRAIDVFEHLRPWRIEIQDWMGECWRILAKGGLLVMRVPSHDDARGYQWRDPTHCRPFTHESFDYFCPGTPSRVHEEFGRFYWGNYGKWWEKISVERDCGDWLFRLRKV